MGNIGSVVGALTYLEENVVVSGDPDVVLNSSSLVLPGVGSFFQAMASLEAIGMDKALLTAVSNKQAKLLGICLGMQLLNQWGDEGGGRAGLGIAPGRVQRFDAENLGSKHLNIGFSEVTFANADGIYEGFHGGVDFYFVHEYRVGNDAFGPEWSIGISNHDEPFVASFEKDNVMGVQFHPEKSQTNGLRLLSNFLRK